MTAGGTIGHAREACPANARFAVLREEGWRDASRRLDRSCGVAGPSIPGSACPNGHCGQNQPDRSGALRRTPARSVNRHSGFGGRRGARPALATGGGHQIEQLQQGVTAILTRSDAALAILDFLPFGIILVDGESTALLVNRRAEQILSEQDGFGTQDGKLSAALPWTLPDCAGDRADMAPCAWIGLACERRLTADAPLGPKAAGHPHRAAKTKIHVLAVLISDPESRTPVEQRLLHQLYRLTRTEARLAAALAEGERLEDATQALG